MAENSSNNDYRVLIAAAILANLPCVFWLVGDTYYRGDRSGAKYITDSSILWVEVFLGTSFFVFLLSFLARLRVINLLTLGSREFLGIGVYQLIVALVVYVLLLFSGK
jgi:hypothetical protein